MADRISSLPDDIIDQILFHLPIADVLRTSVLSSKWSKKKISTQTNLVFDRQCVIRAEDPSVIKSKYSRIISCVFCTHFGTINRVKICNSSCDLVWMNDLSDIECLVMFMTLRPIKELVLDIWLEQRYKMPWRFFFCQSLQHIRLNCCWLKLPPLSKFDGFRNLKTLDLEQVTMTQDAFEILISGSPLLEKLMLADFDGFTQINIRAPNIKFVQIIGKFERISFDNTPQLAKYLLAGIVPIKLPTPCINLTSLSVCINFNDLKEISAVLCLLKSSPNLQAFTIFARFDEHPDLSNLYPIGKTSFQSFHPIVGKTSFQSQSCFSNCNI